jgi:hypothetical protein
MILNQFFEFLVVFGVAAPGLHQACQADALPKSAVSGGPDCVEAYAANDRRQGPRGAARNY